MPMKALRASKARATMSRAGLRPSVEIVPVLADTVRHGIVTMRAQIAALFGHVLQLQCACAFQLIARCAMK